MSTSFGNLSADQWLAGAVLDPRRLSQTGEAHVESGDPTGLRSHRSFIACAVLVHVIRALIWGLIHLISNTVGLLIAWAVLPDFHINLTSFIIAVLIFTVVETLIQPLLRQMAITSVRALQGSVALVTTLVGLIVTDLLSTGLSIQGLTTWILATIIVWLATLLAELILPVLFFKRILDEHGGHRRR
jgi:uncharacterized membrane protein YvlD (DUF360 family)